MSWFTHYRPAAVSQLHLTSVRESLTSLTQGETFPHALLFAGPKGTGKTSSARILAAMLNDPANAATVEAYFFGGDKPKKAGLQEPDAKDELVQRIKIGNSLVVTEMDAASNRGIDDIRSLKERLALPPQEGRMAIYILDEVHMLTNEAFNALLKVLEEPPKHVVFILATTELHKIPETIVSRCLVIPFHRASQAELISALEPIVKAEKVAIDSPEVLGVIAEAAAGSFRDAVKLLEQAAQSNEKLTLESIQSILHRSYVQEIPRLVAAVLGKDDQAVVTILNQIRAQNPSETAVYQSVMQYLHNQMLLGLGVETAGEAGTPIASPQIVHFLLKELQSVTIANGHIPLLSLELKLLELIFRSQAKDGKKGSNSGGLSSSPIKKKTVKATPASVSKLEAASPELLAESGVTDNATEQIEPLVQVDSPIPDEIGVGSGQMLIDRWDVFLDQVQQKNSTIQALLRSAKPIDGQSGKATVAVYYQFHQEQLQQPRFADLLADCSQEVAGGRVSIDFVLQPGLPPAPAQVDATPVVDSVKESQPEDALVELAKSALV